MQRSGYGTVRQGKELGLLFGVESSLTRQFLLKVHLWEDLGLFYLEKNSKVKNITWASSLSSS